jgi:hypothetical protein
MSTREQSLQEEKELGNSIKHQNLLGWTGVQNI